VIRQHRRSGEIGIVFGAWLISYMLAQAWWIGLTVFIQYLFLGVGFVVLILGIVLYFATRR
jgi:hypothetical protein